MDERRAYFRFPVPLEGSFSLDGRVEHPLRVVNLSRGGFLGEVPAPIPSPHRARVRIPLDGNPFEAEAVCLRADYDPPYRAAFCFVGTAPEELDRLQRFLSHRAGDDA